MPLYFLKPLVWNTKNYKAPSGERVNSGYPKDHGFGHEEWNNADTSFVMVDGQRMRTFHTEPFGNQPLDDYPGEIFIFMIASHAGRQYLVGIAGGATSLISEQHAEKRREYSESIAGGKERWAETWAVPRVRKCYGDDAEEFRKHWAQELQWSANWICPPELFYWLDEPMPLNTQAINGKNFVIKMFGGHQSITRETAAYIAGSVRPAKPSQELANIIGRLGSDEADRDADIADIDQDERLDPTTREALRQARIGQGKFRKDLLRLWGDACCVTGCDLDAVLRASHIKPWSESSNRERLDPNNGLPLAATVDALFDRHLISFEDSGEMLVSASITESQRRMLGLPARLSKQPSPEQRRYLALHREVFAHRQS